MVGRWAARKFGGDGPEFRPPGRRFGPHMWNGPTTGPHPEENVP